MTKPRPEFVRDSAERWQHLDGLPFYGERRADPIRRTTTADHGDDDPARTSRLLALVAGNYDGKQRRGTAARWLAPLVPDAGEALQVWDAAQDCRNRATVRGVYEQALPLPLVPEELARRHARVFQEVADNLKPQGFAAAAMACDVLALSDDYAALERYTTALRALAPEYEAATRSIRRNAQLLPWESHPARMNGRKTHAQPDGKTRRMSAAHAVALELAADAYVFAHRGGANAAVDVGNRKRVEKLEAKLAAAADPSNRVAALKGEPPRQIVRYSRWHKLNPQEPERPIAHSGRCGRARVATMTGRTPRYLSRLVTDPERRLFARTARGTRALVVIDMSGSMSLEAHDLERLLDASVGATVVGYAADNDREPNTITLAHRGRRVRTVERYSGGNGVDAPAFVYACRRYATSTTPILWVTDCEAVGRSGQCFEVLDECRKVAKHYGARIERTVGDAVEALNELRQGRRRAANPELFAEVIRRKGHRRQEGNE